MNERDDRDEKLKRVLDRTLRELPPRRAPVSLEMRVLDRLQRAAMPWWRQSFGHWPTPVRALFLLVCCVLARLAWVGSSWVSADIPSVSKLQHGVPVINAAGEIMGSLARAIPSTWIYEGVVLGAVLYAMLFGLSAAAYRMFFLKR